MRYILKELSGTKENDFSIGVHQALSEGTTFAVRNDKGKTLLAVSPAKLVVSAASFYWGVAPLTQGTHNIGDIVWNVNADNPDSILCWRCTQAGSPGQWLPQYAAKPLLPSTAPEGTIAQFTDGEWRAAALDQLQINAEQVLGARFLGDDQQALLEVTEGINTGDETRATILAKLGKATSLSAGYLATEDYDRFNTAYNLSTQLAAITVELPTKLSDLTDDLGVVTSSQLPKTLSDLVNDTGYVTQASLPTRLSQFINDLTLTSAPAYTRVSELVNDSGFISADRLELHRLVDLFDVEISSNTLDQSDALTFNATKNKWVAGEVAYVTQINNVTPIAGRVTITTTQIPEGSNQYFTRQRADSWGQSFIASVQLGQLADLDLDQDIEGAFLYREEGKWRARTIAEIASITLGSLTDVTIGPSLLNNQTLTFSEGQWRPVALTSNPDYKLDALLDTQFSAIQGDQIIIYDSNLRKWVNAEIDLANGTITSNQYSTLKALNDTYINGFNLLDGAVLRYNGFQSRWEPSLSAASVSSVNGLSGAVSITTDNIPEGGNFYYTTARVDQRITERLATISLNDVLGIGADATAPGSVMHFNGDYWQGLPISQLNINLEDVNGFETIGGAVNRDILIRQDSLWVPQSIDVLLQLNLGELLDVTVASPLDNQTIIYDELNEVWVNADISSVYSEWIVVPVTSAAYTANDREVIPCDTSLAGFTVTTPAAGRFRVIDLIGTSPDTGFGANNLTITPATGTTIMGGGPTDSLILDVGAVSPEFQLIGTEWRISNHG